MLFSLRKAQALWALGTLFFGGHVATAIDLSLDNTDSIKQAARICADGMMSFYNGNQTGGVLGLLPGPYYWWEAGAMFGQMIEYWFLTGDTSYNDVVTEGILAQISPTNDFMPTEQVRSEGNDDQAFWAFAALSAAEMKFPDPPDTPKTKAPSWLGLAQAVFNEQVARWDTQHCGGGLRWQIFQFNKGYDYKNSISNGGFFQLAARLARYTNNQTYADWADKSWDWMVDSVLIDKDFRVYDGTYITDNCHNVSKIQWTYNAGTMLMGAANMYNLTDAAPKWRNRLQLVLEAIAVFFPPQYGNNIMVEVACETQGTCNYDQPSFKAYLSRWMAATVQLAPFTNDFIMPKLKASALGAAGQCSGAPRGNTMCGRKWFQKQWDNNQGVGEQMAAMSVIQNNLIKNVPGPVSLQKGGTSKSDPSAGTTDPNTPAAVPRLLTRQITAGDKAGASILTGLSIGGLLGTLYWISFA